MPAVVESSGDGDTRTRHRNVVEGDVANWEGRKVSERDRRKEKRVRTVNEKLSRILPTPTSVLRADTHRAHRPVDLVHVARSLLAPSSSRVDVAGLAIIDVADDDEALRLADLVGTLREEEHQLSWEERKRKKRTFREL